MFSKINKNNKVVIRLGGSVISPSAGEINIDYLIKFKDLIVEYVKEKDYSFAIICGGGGLFRSYADSAKKITDDKVSNIVLDWLGIYTNNLHARFLLSIFPENLVFDEVVTDLKTITNVKKPISIVGAEKPGHSSNYDAVEIAYFLEAKTIVNLSNISYVYDKDPNKYQDAVYFDKINWTDYLKLIPEHWTPALSTPFDPVSSRRASSLDLSVVFMEGKEINNLKNYLDNNLVNGTIIEN